MFEELAYVSLTDATTFSAFLNVNRIATSNFNDQSCATQKTEEDILRSRIAMYNQNFRLAVMLSLDRATYNAQTVGEELKLTSLVNSYTPRQLRLPGERDHCGHQRHATTFPAGTYYGAVMQAQMDADGFPVKVWDPEADGGIGSSAAFDGWYNPEAAAPTWRPLLPSWLSRVWKFLLRTPSTSTCPTSPAPRPMATVPTP